MDGLEGLGFDLNSREVAILIYTAAFFGWASIFPTVRQSAMEVVKAFFQRPILVTLGAMTTYVVGSVSVLAVMDVWQWTNLKTTILWWMGFAFVSMFEASKVTEEPGKIRRMARESLNVTTIIVFIAEFHTLPLWGEMILVPFVTVVAMMLALAQTRPENAIVVGPLTTVQAIIGLGVLGYGAYSVLQDFQEFATLGTVREFAVPILLSLMFLPFLFCLSVVMTLESTFTSLRFMKQNEALVRYAHRKAIMSFALDTDGLKRFARLMRLEDIEDRAGVDAALREIKRLKARERHPPVVPPSQGWPPYEAQQFLSAFGMVTRDYHRSFDDWRAEAPSIKLNDRPFTDHVSYYISGTEEAATRLRLALDASFINDTAAADAAFYDRSRALLAKVFGEAQADDLLERIKTADDHTLTVAGKTIEVGHSTWGDSKVGGHDRNLVILHEAHVATDHG